MYVFQPHQSHLIPEVSEDIPSLHPDDIVRLLHPDSPDSEDVVVISADGLTLARFFHSQGDPMAAAKNYCDENGFVVAG